jgi:hypothetical protein
MISKSFGFLSFVIVIILVFAGIAFSRHIAQNNQIALQPKVNWSEASVTVSLSPGQATTKELFFTSSETLTNVSVEAVPEIARFFTMEPIRFQSVAANQSKSVRLVFSIPAQTELGTYEGTVQLRTKNTTIPQTLKVNIKVVFQTYTNTDLGLSFQYPQFAQETKVEIEQTESQIFIDIDIKDAADNQFYPVFGLAIYNNPPGQSLTQWFSGNVDVNNILLSTETFQEWQLSNSIRALVRSKPVPDYGGGPVADSFAISPLGNKIISIQQSQDSLLSELGYSQSDIQTLMRRVLGTIQFN